MFESFEVVAKSNDGHLDDNDQSVIDSGLLNVITLNLAL